MTTDTSSPLETSVSCRRDLPLSVERLDGAPDATRQARLERRNEVLLLMLETLEGGTDAEDGEQNPELRRLERKVDLILELLFEHLDEPAGADIVSACFNEHGVRWSGGDVAAGLGEGDWVVVEMQVHPLLPRALRLTGRVVSRDKDGGEVHFAPLSASLRDSLARFVFRQHRRDVARLRARQDDG